MVYPKSPSQRKLIEKVRKHPYYPFLNGVEKHALLNINFENDEEASKLIFDLLSEMEEKYKLMKT